MSKEKFSKKKEDSKIFRGSPQPIKKNDGEITAQNQPAAREKFVEQFHRERKNERPHPAVSVSSTYQKDKALEPYQRDGQKTHPTLIERDSANSQWMSHPQKEKTEPSKELNTPSCEYSTESITDIPKTPEFTENSYTKKQISKEEKVQNKLEDEHPEYLNHTQKTKRREEYSSELAESSELSSGEKLEEDLFQPGEQVNQYKIKKRIGIGGMSYVYLAKDTKLGRNVALKFIHKKYFHSKEAMGKFLEEARATAQLNHPNIVYIYEAEVWNGIPYVALEYIRGKTLREKINEEAPLPIGDALTIALSVSKAIYRAHRAKIVHCDLKPENILTTKKGIVKVLDFGLAKRVSIGREDERDLEESSELSLAELEGILEDTNWPKVSRIKGTPAYMAPEQWKQGAALTPATDVWALGVILYEMLSGKRPFTGKSVLELHNSIQRDPPPPLPANIPPEIAQLTEKCLRKAPSRRISSSRLPEILEQLLFSYRAGYNIAENNEPFIGLQPFDTQRAHLFFGREREITAFFEQMREQPVLPIIGPSGAGKTSFVMAGIIPRLLEQRRWIIIKLNSYRDPFFSIAKKLFEVFRNTDTPDLLISSIERESEKKGEQSPLKLDSPELTLAQHLKEKPRLLSILLYRLAEERHKNIALILDQLENLIISTSPDVRKLFTSALTPVAEDPLDPVRLIFTLRDDFIGRFADNRDAQDLLEKVFILRTPDANALRDILVKPVAIRNYSYSSEKFVQRIIREIEGEAAGLPLLQIAGQILWEKRDKKSKKLLEEVYNQMGGVGGALTKHADGVLNKIPDSHKNTAKQILLRLIDPQGIRRPVPKKELLYGLPEGSENILKILIDQRLLSVHTSEDAAGEPIVELIHDSLIQRWPTLNRWFKESKEELKFLRDLEQVAEMWHKRGRRPSEVWTGEALREALTFRKRYPYHLPPKVEDFLNKGIQLEQRRQKLKKVIYFSTAGILSILLMISLWIALVFKRQKEAISRRWALSQQHGARSAMLRGDFLSAYALLRTALENLDTPSLRALWRRLQISPIYWEKKLNVNLRSLLLLEDILEDKKQLVVGGRDGALFSINLQTGEKKTLRAHSSPVLAIAYSPTLQILASASWEGKIALWKYSKYRKSHWKLLNTWTPHRAPVRTLIFHPKLPILLTASFTGVQAWKLSTFPTSSKKVYLKKVSLPKALARSRVYCARFSSDGNYLAISTYSKKIFVYHWKNQKLKSVKLPAKGQIADFYFIPHSPIFFAAGTLPEIMAISAKTLNVKPFPSRHINAITSLAIENIDGKTYLATASVDSTVNIWKISQTDRLNKIKLIFYNTLKGHTNAVYQIQFAKKKKLLASVGEDQTIKLWRFSNKMERIHSTGHRNRITSLSFTPLGDRIASAGNDKTIRLWDTSTGLELLVIRGHKNTINRIAISPDGSRIVSSSYDNTIRVWELKEKEKGFFKFRESYRFYRYRLSHTNDPFSLEGDKLSMLRGSLIYIWDLLLPIRSHFWNAATILPPIEEPKASKRSLPIYQTPSSFILQDAAFHPTKPQIATMDTGRRIRLWRLSDHRFLRELIAPQPVYELHIEPTGKYLFALSLNAQIFIWNLNKKKKFTPKPDKILRGHQIYITSFAPGPIGLLALSTDRAGNIFLWDLMKNKKIPLEKNKTPCTNAAIRPDRRELSYTCNRNTTLVIWKLSPKCRENILNSKSSQSIPPEIKEKCRYQFPLTDDKISTILYNPLSKNLAFGTTKGKLYLWDSHRNSPLWWTILFSPALNLSLSHRGWRRLIPDTPHHWPNSKRPAWAEFLSRWGQLAKTSPNGRYIAIYDTQRRLSLWEISSDKKLYITRQLPSPTHLATTDTGTAFFISQKKFWKIEINGKLRTVKKEISTLFISKKIQIFAGKNAVWSKKPNSTSLQKLITLRRQLEPSALYMQKNKLFVGYKTGYLEIFRKIKGFWHREKKLPPLLSTPLSAISSILPGTGKGDIIILGFENGFLGIWSLKSGYLLEKIKLHGKVDNLALLGSHLVASTDLGDFLRWDLSIYSRPYCQIVKEVWKKVPIIWKKGRILLKLPPTEHPCATSPSAL